MLNTIPNLVTAVYIFPNLMMLAVKALMVVVVMVKMMVM
jgi:hypothetical protein